MEKWMQSERVVTYQRELQAAFARQNAADAAALADTREAGWTEVVQEDLAALARLAALAPITPQELAWAGYPSEEDVQEAEDWVDEDTLPLFCPQWSSAPRVAASAGPGSGLAMLAGLGRRLAGCMRTWPANAPLRP